MELRPSEDNSVTRSTIINDSMTMSTIINNSVTRSTIINNSVTRSTIILLPTFIKHLSAIIKFDYKYYDE